MLFSNELIAGFVNENFEPVWKAVRVVPIITIDFGNGNVVTRTLNGNIATYVCASDGTTLDILPGIYEPNSYLIQLDQFVKLHRWVGQNGSDRSATLARYHRLQGEALAKDGQPLAFEMPLSRTKKFIERAMKLVLTPRAKQAASQVATVSSSVTPSTPSNLESSNDVARWKVLAEDTRVNESIRRRAIHEFLAKQRLVQPEAITKWLYREVLHADIDDPYLGLGETLFANYPFKDQ